VSVFGECRDNWKSGVLEKKEMYAFSVSSYGVMYWRKNKEKLSRLRIPVGALGTEPSDPARGMVHGGCWTEPI